MNRPQRRKRKQGEAILTPLLENRGVWMPVIRF
jgi:hypothetical protein